MRLSVILGVAMAVLLVVTGSASAHALKKHDQGDLQAPALHLIRFLDRTQKRLALESGVAAIKVKKPVYAIPKRSAVGQRGKSIEGRWSVIRTLQMHIRAQKAARKDLRAGWAVRERDFHKALVWATGLFGSSYGWVHGCAHNEGGHGPALIWNTGGSGAYGPGQFMLGTWTWMSNAAWKQAAAQGVRIPRHIMWGGSPYSSRSDTLAGQAIAMAWAFSRGLSRHWVAPGC